MINYDNWKLKGEKEYPELPDMEFIKFKEWMIENREEIFDEKDTTHLALLEQWEDEYFESLVNRKKGIEEHD